VFFRYLRQSADSGIVPFQFQEHCRLVDCVVADRLPVCQVLRMPDKEAGLGSAVAN
jgi:hypothetical protein